MSINTLKVNQRKFKKNIRRADRLLRNKLPKASFKRFVKETPRDGGNAKRNTQLKITKSGYEIIGKYPYSEVLDKGLYGKPPGSANGPKTRNGYSKQAPNGMVKPTMDYTIELFRRYFRRFR